MKHRLFYSLLLALALPLTATAAVSESADNARWSYYLSYHNATQTVAAGNVVYALCNGNLLVYDTETQSVFTPDKLSCSLSGTELQSIGWSNTQKCLVALYADNTIDFIYPEDGDGATGRFSVFKLAQIRDYIESNITINHLNVYGDWACLTTNDGVIVVDVKGNTVRGYYQIGSGITDAVVLGKRVYLAQDRSFIRGELTDNLYDRSSWAPTINNVSVSRIVGAPSGAYIIVGNGSSINAGINHLSINDNGTVEVEHVSSHLMADGTSNGKLVQFYAPKDVVLFNDDDYTNRSYVSATVSPNGVTRTTNGRLFSAEGYDGLRFYNVSTLPETLPEAEGTVGNFGPRHNPHGRMLLAGGKLYVTGNAISSNRTEGFLGSFDGSRWSDMDEDSARVNADMTGRWPWSGYQYLNISHVAVDPNDVEHVYATSNLEGMYEYRNAKFENLYNSSNSPITYPSSSSGLYNNSSIQAGGCSFDANGNLWVTNNFADTTIVVRKPNGDWLRIPFDELDKRGRAEKILHDSRGWAWINEYESTTSMSSGLACINYNGTLANFDDDQTLFRATTTNEDGSSISLEGVKDVVEDRNGEIWLGCETGVFNIPDPTTWFSSSFTINQPKVPRNDGTNYADYLLTGNIVRALAVDCGNRKWIGTLGAGLYLVSEDGTEVISHYTADNSPLLSDNVNALAIDSLSGVLYVTTDKGMCSYRTGVTAPTNTLSKSELRIFPNPVRPDYQGLLNVTGLTAEAEVKVLTSGQQLVARGNAIGGSWQWDLTNQNTGNRVGAGVYFIMVSTADGKTSIAGKVVII